MSMAALAETSKHQITVQVAATQFQKGGTDCGVYAIDMPLTYVMATTQQVIDITRTR